MDLVISWVYLGFLRSITGRISKPLMVELFLHKIRMITRKIRMITRHDNTT